MPRRMQVPGNAEADAGTKVTGRPLAPGTFSGDAKVGALLPLPLSPPPSPFPPFPSSTPPNAGADAGSTTGSVNEGCAPAAGASPVVTEDGARDPASSKDCAGVPLRTAANTPAGAAAAPVGSADPVGVPGLVPPASKAGAGRMGRGCIPSAGAPPRVARTAIAATPAARGAAAAAGGATADAAAAAGAGGGAAADAAATWGPRAPFGRWPATR